MQKRFSEEQIVELLRGAEKGDRSIGEVCRAHNVSESAFYRWCNHYGGMQLPEVKRLKDLGFVESAAPATLISPHPKSRPATKSWVRGCMPLRLITNAMDTDQPIASCVAREKPSTTSGCRGYGAWKV